MNTFYLATEYYCLPSHIDDPENAPFSEKADATVNIFVKPGTPEADHEKIYSELEPILREYSVSTVNIAAPTSQKELDNIIAEESFTNNSYYYNRDGIDWINSYAVKY